MPAKYTPKNQAMFARKVAYYINRTPAKPSTLYRELKCTQAAFMNAVDDLSLLGVKIVLSDAGWSVDPSCWARCQTLATEFADALAMRERA